MDKVRVLREMASIEAHLKRYDVAYYSVVGHYRRWLATAVPGEEEMIRERILSLFVGVESINEVFIEDGNRITPEEAEGANRVFDRQRLSLMQALQGESNEIIAPQPVYDEDVVLTPIKAEKNNWTTRDYVSLGLGLIGTGWLLQYIVAHIGW